MNDSIDIRSLKQKKSIKQNAPVNKNTGNYLLELLNRDIQLIGNGFPDKTKESLYTDLGSLLEAGIDIRSSLELIQDEQKKKKIKSIIAEVSEHVVGGTTLSEAVRKTGKFSAYEYYSIQIGEETGKLITVLRELGVFYQNKIKQNRQIIGALTYPAVVLFVAMGAVSFMLGYVVPMFSDIFKRFGNDLPAITQFIIRLSVFVKSNVILFIVIVTGTVFFLWTQRDKVWFRKYSSLLILKIPVIGGIMRKIYLSRFANTMSLLTGSKIPILQSIQLTRQMVNFYPVEQSLIVAEERILNGTALHESLKEFTVYPPKLISMIKVGEEVNQLDTFFNRISTQYAGEVEHQTGLLSKFLEPIIIILLGVVVGAILIAMYLPLFKLGQSF